MWSVSGVQLPSAQQQAGLLHLPGSNLLGTNKRYQPPATEWDPPWPPIQISDCEWIIIRNYPEAPAALVRRFDATAEHTTHFRVATWRATSARRELIGRYESLKAADRAVFFDLTNSAARTEPPDQMWAKQRSTRPSYG